MITWTVFPPVTRIKVLFVSASRIIQIPILPFWPTKNHALFVVENDARHSGRVEELDVRLASPCRWGWSIYLPEVLFHCSTALYWLASACISWLLLIQIDTQRMIFRFFFPDVTDGGGFLQCSSWPFCPVFSFSFLSSSVASSDCIYDAFCPISDKIP